MKIIYLKIAQHIITFLFPYIILFRCKQIIISFVVSSLLCPEMFEENSSNSLDDLITILCEDNNPLISKILGELIEELQKQDSLHQVIYLFQLPYFFRLQLTSFNLDYYGNS